MKDIHNQHINQHYVKFNTEELKRLVQIITINREEDTVSYTHLTLPTKRIV